MPSSVSQETGRESPGGSRSREEDIPPQPPVSTADCVRPSFTGRGRRKRSAGANHLPSRMALVRRFNELEKRLEDMESRRMERTEEMHAEVVELLTREVTAFERYVDFVTNRRT